MPGQGTFPIGKAPENELNLLGSGGTPEQPAPEALPSKPNDSQEVPQNQSIPKGPAVIGGGGIDGLPLSPADTEIEGANKKGGSPPSSAPSENVMTSPGNSSAPSATSSTAKKLKGDKYAKYRDGSYWKYLCYIYFLSGVNSWNDFELYVHVLNSSIQKLIPPGLQG